jgi:hypothetical protein
VKPGQEAAWHHPRLPIRPLGFLSLPHPKLSPAATKIKPVNASKDILKAQPALIPYHELSVSMAFSSSYGAQSECHRESFFASRTDSYRYEGTVR